MKILSTLWLIERNHVNKDLICKSVWMGYVNKWLQERNNHYFASILLQKIYLLLLTSASYIISWVFIILQVLKIIPEISVEKYTSSHLAL